MQKQRKSDVPPTLSVFLENKLCYIFKKTLFHFSSRFDIWHHGIVNLQQAEYGDCTQTNASLHPRGIYNSGHLPYFI